MQEKISFLQNNLLAAVNSLQGNEVPKWGKMNAQQAIEHMSAFFALSFGKVKMPLVSPEEKLPQLQAFILSDIPFKENTKAAVLPEEPLPVRNDTLDAAKEELTASVHAFFTHFEINPTVTELHPIFGNLDYKHWVHLHYKHVVHHMTQFHLL
jgi:hypothetical protein